MFKKFKVAILTLAITLLSIVQCFASSGSKFDGVTSAITTAGSDMLTASGPIITAAISLGIVFWGAKLLWSKFKSMAK